MHNIQDDMRYCVGHIWNERRYHKEINNGIVIPAIDEIDLPDLASFLSHSILEVRKKMVINFLPTHFTTLLVGFSIIYNSMGSQPLIFLMTHFQS